VNALFGIANTPLMRMARANIKACFFIDLPPAITGSKANARRSGVV
jgi:hypothetical protein